MDKWMLISIYNRELEAIKMYDTCEEAQAAMKKDFIDTIGVEDYEVVCAENGYTDCVDWSLGDYDAWISGMDCIDWHIVLIAA